MSLSRAVRPLRRYGPRLLRWCIGLAVCASIAALYFTGSLAFIERPLASARFQLVKSEPSGEIVLVAIDARSLREMSVWPWPRSWHATVIDQLHAAGARQIAVDIDFSASSSPGEDDALAAALARAGGTVILPIFEQPADAKNNVAATAPLPQFAQHTRIASANVRPDSDGIVRRLSRVELWSGTLVPTMAAAAAGLQPSAIGSYYIDFSFRPQELKTVSYVDVLRGAVDPQTFAGKTVLIGATALELGDTVATPAGGVMPGVMLQALATESLLQQRDLHKVSRWLVLVVACMLFFLIEAICRDRGWVHGLAAGGGVLIAVLLLPLAVQANLPLMVDTAPWLAALAAAFLVAIFEKLRDLDLRLIGQAILLRRTDALMRLVVQNSYDGLLIIDENGIVRSVNPAVERMLGQPGKELAGQHFFDVIATPSHQPPIHSLSRMAYADRPSQVELTRPDGTTLIADVALTRLPDHPNAAFVALLHDVTEMKMREAELRAARDQAEAASNSKSQFLANMSHELRTPLNAVIGFSEIMKTELLGPIGTETYRGYSESIHDSAKHLLGIINDILDISSIEAGTPRLHEGIHEPEQICQSVVALVAGRAETAKVTLAVHVDPAADLLFADGRMMKQMLINLVGNAIKFSPKGGLVEIRVTAANAEPHSGVIFAVADHGIGIAKEDVPRILKPFEQVETAFARNFDGVGLGLPLVNSMARLHGAALTIDSELDVGTTVSILFPAARTRPRPSLETEAAPTGESERPAAEERKLRIVAAQ
ncbi:CHASE2 domain-containing protein [Dongia deserti]|uniref:CHASE2 domain-containing protein n=1 Tax=Dongia deserti TaxID=2268030 RepID=UPI000E6495DF|nr:CHASE2 domain-containing protein [Dongia deserti]